MTWVARQSMSRNADPVPTRMVEVMLAPLEVEALQDVGEEVPCKDALAVKLGTIRKTQHAATSSNAARNPGT